MKVTLKILARNLDQSHINGVLALIEQIKKDHPNLFQQVEMVVES